MPQIFPLSTLPRRVVGRVKLFLALRNAVDDSIPLKEIAKYLPHNPVIVEAGAHNGSETVSMVRFWPQAQIHAFEPVPSIFAQLENKTRAFPQVVRHNTALGKETGQSTLYVSSGGSDASSSLLPPKEHLITNPHVKFEEEIIVQTITLDDWKRRDGIKKIDFLWLDMQGYELAALKAGLSVLEDVQAIYMEVNTLETYAGAPLLPEAEAWLKGRGFRMAAVKIPYSDGGNALFIREDGRPTSVSRGF